MAMTWSRTIGCQQSHLTSTLTFNRDMAYRLAVISTHPIQYQAPWFKAVARSAEIELDVFFCHNATPQEQADAGFGVAFDWDISLLDGYRHRFLRNVARNPTIATFGGLDTPEIKDIIARNRFDAVLVHGWNYKAAWQAIRACWRTKTPIMVRGDSHLLTNRHPLKKALKRVVYTSFIPRFDACLAVGELSKLYYLYYGASADRVFIVPHVINDQMFESEASRWEGRRPDLRRLWQLDDDAAIFLFAAKFVEKKRPLDFVKAIESAAQSRAPVMGLMVGDGPLRRASEEYVAVNNVPIRFAGFLNQTEIVKAYVASDALVMTSDGGETWGLVANEAMTCGRACVVSDAVGCGPDLILSGRTGAIFPMGDVKALSALISDLAHDRARLSVMGECAKEQAQKFSIQSSVEQLRRAVAMVCR